jgi:hypothetical protein
VAPRLLSTSLNIPKLENLVAKMPPYDSESSDEGEDYTETNVLLGYATEDATGDAVSHLGGAPVRLYSSSFYVLKTNDAL